jgi:aldose 1-epimerase
MADQNNRKAEIFELNNGTMRVLVSNLGCTITSLSVPGKDGEKLPFTRCLIFNSSVFD